jgi:Zn finger protein HypA/HybF involved in hydrogenase expression
MEDKTMGEMIEKKEYISSDGKYINALGLAEQIFADGRIDNPDDWGEMQEELRIELYNLGVGQEEVLGVLSRVKEAWYEAKGTIKKKKKKRKKIKQILVSCFECGRVLEFKTKQLIESAAVCIECPSCEESTMVIFHEHNNTLQIYTRYWGEH